MFGDDQPNTRQEEEENRLRGRLGLYAHESLTNGVDRLHARIDELSREINAAHPLNARLAMELSIKSARIRELECQLEHHRELHRQLFVKLATAEEALRDLKKEDRT